MENQPESQARVVGTTLAGSNIAEGGIALVRIIPGYGGAAVELVQGITRSMMTLDIGGPWSTFFAAAGATIDILGTIEVGSFRESSRKTAAQITPRWREFLLPIFKNKSVYFAKRCIKRLFNVAVITALVTSQVTLVKFLKSSMVSR